jgi:hypothetical protein
VAQSLRQRTRSGALLRLCRYERTGSSCTGRRMVNNARNAMTLAPTSGPVVNSIQPRLGGTVYCHVKSRSHRSLSIVHTVVHWSPRGDFLDWQFRHAATSGAVNVSVRMMRSKQPKIQKGLRRMPAITAVAEPSAPTIASSLRQRFWPAAVLVAGGIASIAWTALLGYALVGLVRMSL